jgi:hypothetical protein
VITASNTSTRRPVTRWLVALLLVMHPGRAAWARQAPTIPDTPAGRTLSDFLDAFNTADRAKLDAYVKMHDPTETVDDLATFGAQTGGFTLLSIVASAPDYISFRVRHKADGGEVLGTFVVGHTVPHRVESWTLRTLPAGATIDTTPLDAVSRGKVIDAISAQLTGYYVYPEVAERMVQAIQDHQRQGYYNAVTNGAQFASLLHADLFAVSKDRHVSVDFNPVVVPGRRAGGEAPHAPTPADVERHRLRLEHSNCQFTRVEILPRNIGYLKFNQFMDPEVCGATVTAAMAFIAHTDAVIVDLRENGGGDPAMVQLIASYFFDHSVRLSDLYNRHDGTITQYWTLPFVTGTRILAPLYILTSRHTFSGAEAFSYDMQGLKRATIVGETTGGGAHPVDGMPAGDHFTVGVPFARPINPVTKTDWEGTGVVPDKKMPAAAALDSATKLAEDRLTARQP